MEKDFDFLKVGMDNDITNNIPKEILIGYKKKINKTSYFCNRKHKTYHR